MPPNNKKKRKSAKGNKKKKSSDAATTDGTSAAPPLSRRSVRHLVGCPHNPASCEKCVYAFPRGCLHTLRETERDSAEFYEILRIYKDSFTGRGSFWIFEDNKEVPCVVKKRMARFLVYMAIKIIVGRNSFEDLSGEDYREQAKYHIMRLLNVYGIIKCGSIVAASEAIAAEDVALLRNESQVSFRALSLSLHDVNEQGYYGLVYIMHELSPCDCLKTELERVTNEIEQNGEGEPSLLKCSSGCGNKEQLDGERYGCCPKCKMAVYCSRDCQKAHWKGRTAMEQPHKVACYAIQELQAFLANDGRSDTIAGNDE